MDETNTPSLLGLHASFSLSCPRVSNLTRLPMTLTLTGIVSNTRRRRKGSVLLPPLWRRNDDHPADDMYMLRRDEVYGNAMAVALVLALESVVLATSFVI